MDNLFLNDSLGEITTATDEPKHSKYILLLAHGAGAGYNHKFMSTLAESISARNGTVVRFNFPYMEAGKKFPGAPKHNIQTIGLLVKHLKEQHPNIPLFLAGKSYGGRMSSHWVHKDPETVTGLIYFGFPLHAPGKASTERANHLPEIDIPQLFIQGTNDALAKYDLIEQVVKSCKKAELKTISDGDHSFKIPKKISNKPHSEIISELGKMADEWIINQLSS